MNKSGELPPRDEYDEKGVNLTVIRANLKLTPHERLMKGEERQRQAIELQKFVRSRQPLAEADPLVVDRNTDSLNHLLAIKRIREETGLK